MIDEYLINKNKIFDILISIHYKNIIENVYISLGTNLELLRELHFTSNKKEYDWNKL